MHLSRLLLWALAVAVVATFAATIAGILNPIVMPNAWKLLGSGVLAVVFLGVALGCALPLENGRAPRLMCSGIAMGIAALVGWVCAVWLADYMTIFVWQRVVTWPTTWACLMMLIGLLLLPKARRGWWMWLRRASIVLLALLAAHICLATTFYPDYGWQATEDQWEKVWRYETFAYRTGGVLALLAGGGVVVTFLVAWLPGLTGRPETEVERLSYWVQCPRCKAEQQALTGTYACRDCRLQMRVEVT